MLALRDLIGEHQVNAIIKTITDRHRNSNRLEMNSIEFLEEVYNVTPSKYHHLITDWFKKVITYDLAIEDGTYKTLENGTFEVTINIKAKRFETLNSGEAKPIAINEPIKIGLFTTHPSLIKADDSALLHYESVVINKETTEVKIIVNEKPNYIAIDPFGTRSDENTIDNLLYLK